MSDTQTMNSLQWIEDVGVPKADVKWLASVQGSPQLNHPVTRQRVQEILDRATVGLLATIKTHAPAAV